MEPLTIGRELRYLVPSHFESRLLGKTRLYTKEAGGWTKAVKNQGLFFDLSKVEWVDIGALAQLVLLVESALINQIKVTVALPFSDFRSSEQFWMGQTSDRLAERVRYRVSRRKKAFNFLHHIQFTAALQPKHLGENAKLITILDSYDSSLTNQLEVSGEFFDEGGAGETDAELAATFDKEILYKDCFPLTWLSIKEQDKFYKIGKFLSGVISSRKRGVEAIDANTFANVILYEMVDNVHRYAGGNRFALVAAIALPEQMVFDEKHYLDSDKSYIGWLSQKNSPIVDIVVGDSGSGIPNKLRENFKKLNLFKANTETEGAENTQILKWAFDRWSTSRLIEEVRGTRGLYRVDRIVSKYQGLITIRSENQNVGFDHGGPSYDEPVFSKQRLSYLPGSVLRTRMLSLHEGFLSQRTSPRPAQAATLFNISLGNIDENGISKDKQEPLKTLLRNAPTGSPVGVIAVIEGGAASKDAVENTLRHCMMLRHPVALILLGLPGGWNLIKNTIDSLNSEYENTKKGIEAFKREHFEIWDPTLVLGEDGQAAWVGATGSSRIVLDALFSAGGKIEASKFETMLPNAKERESILRYFRADPNLIRINADGSLELRITISEVVEFTKKRLRDYVSQNSAKGMLSSGIYRTPSLSLVNKWLSVETIIENTVGEKLAMFALSQLVKTSKDWQEPRMLLADSTVSPVHLESLREFLSISIKETMPGEMSVSLFNRKVIPDDNKKVIVYCDVIAGSEAVRRCLRQIKRDDGEPVAVCCIFDARKEKTPTIPMHDLEVPVISICPIETAAVAESENQQPTNINPVTLQPEAEDKTDIEARLSKGELQQLIENNESLHFNHIGRSIGRHFTFYLDANRLVALSPIADKINDLIDETVERWRNEAESDSSPPPNENIDIWIPSQKPNTTNAVKFLAEEIMKLRSDVKSVKDIRREAVYGRWTFKNVQTTNSKHSPAIVIIDWGSLTGATVMQTLRLASESGTRHILSCIVLSQLRQDDENFYRSISELKTHIQVRSGAQDLLPGLPFENAYETELRVAKVAVEFLGKFPLESYTSSDACPVCQQLNRIEQERYPTILLENYAKKQFNGKLRLRNHEEILNSQPKDFNEEDIPSAAALWMLNLRGELVGALGSTNKRCKLVEKIDQIIESFSETECSQACWFLHFLSVESQWLRCPPLYFRFVREKIGKIALVVALNKNLSDAERLNAIIVLRTASKYDFAKNFLNIFRESTNSEELITQLLYDAFTYLARPYHQSEKVLSPLNTQLTSLQTKLDDKEIILAIPNQERFLETIQRLVSRAETEMGKAGVRFDSPLRAWLKLRHDLSANEYQSHESVPEAIRELQPQKDEREAIEKELSAFNNEPVSGRLLPEIALPWVSSIPAYWKTCYEFVDKTILPRLSILKDILTSQDGKISLGQNTVDKLIILVEELKSFRSPVAESEFSDFVRSLENDPNKIFNREKWDMYVQTVDWYWKKILRPIEDDAEHIAEPSDLIKFLMSAPTDLSKTYKTVYDKVKNLLPEHQTIGDEVFSSEHKVFCPESLLHSILREVLINIPNHMADNSEKVDIQFEITQDDYTIELVVRNNKSEIRTPAGEGLRRLNNRLKYFDAFISTSRPTDSNFTFEVNAKFLKGE